MSQQIKKELYRKPSTSPHAPVRILFDIATENGIGTEAIATKAGYSRDAILALRRPTTNGRGQNPTFQLLKDVAQTLGYEFKLVPRGWRGQDEIGD